MSSDPSRSKKGRGLTAVGLLFACATFGAWGQTRPVPRPPIIIVPPTVYPSPYVYPEQGFTFHGAIAYQRRTGALGYSFDWATQREADVNALDQCGDPQCVVLARFDSGYCGALAVGAQGPFAENGATLDEARTKALMACADPSCEVKVWACTK
ncbi:MAG: DUF4189 domain-containing protein [Burkholderiales bacterium]